MLSGPVTGGVPAGTPFFITESDDMKKPFMTDDQQLQKMRDKHLIHVEQHLRSALSFAFCDTFGDNQAAYLNQNNYDTGKPPQKSKDSAAYKKCLLPLLKNRTDYPYI